jgi:hypothetical protein
VQIFVLVPDTKHKGIEKTAGRTVKRLGHLTRMGHVRARAKKSRFLQPLQPRKATNSGNAEWRHDAIQFVVGQHANAERVRLSPCRQETWTRTKLHKQCFFKSAPEAHVPFHSSQHGNAEANCVPRPPELCNLIKADTSS